MEGRYRRRDYAPGGAVLMALVGPVLMRLAALCLWPAACAYGPDGPVHMRLTALCLWLQQESVFRLGRLGPFLIVLQRKSNH